MEIMGIVLTAKVRINWRKCFLLLVKNRRRNIFLDNTKQILKKKLWGKDGLLSQGGDSFMNNSQLSGISGIRPSSNFLGIPGKDAMESP